MCSLLQFGHNFTVLKNGIEGINRKNTNQDACMILLGQNVENIPVRKTMYADYFVRKHVYLQLVINSYIFFFIKLLLLVLLLLVVSSIVLIL